MLVNACELHLTLVIIVAGRLVQGGTRSPW
jgi:hypothetical protein